MKSNKLTRELRYSVSAPEIRNDGESREVTGYAVVFESESVDLGGFTEIIDRKALDGVIERSDVLCLLNHDDSQGVLARSSFGQGSLKLEVDEKGLKYSFSAPKTVLGDSVLESLRRGDLKSSSFGFTVANDRFEKRNDGSILRRIYAIERLYDVSPVWHPAYQDSSVQCRSFDEFIKSLDEENNMNKDEQIASLTAELEELRKQVRQEPAEEKKEEEVEKKAEENEEKEEERECSDSEEKKEEKSEENEEKEEKRSVEPASQPTEEIVEKRTSKFNSINVNMNQNKEKFSLLRSINDVINKRGLNDQAREMNNIALEECRQAGVSVSGQIHIPFGEIRADGVYAKQGDTSGGYNIAEDKYGILEPLYARLLFPKLGCTMMQGLHGDISIPTYSGTSANWAGEIEKAQNGAGEWGELKMSPKRLTSVVEISLQFLAQSTNSAEQMLKRDIVTSIANKLEATVFGDKAGTATQPAGLLYNVTPDSQAIEYADLILMEEELEDSNIYGEKKYVTAPSSKAILRGTKKDAGSGLYVCENEMINGISVLSSSNVASNGVILGAWENLVIGSWAGVSLTVDDISKIDEGRIRLIVNSFWDVLVRRPEAFVKKILA